MLGTAHDSLFDPLSKKKTIINYSHSHQNEERKLNDTRQSFGNEQGKETRRNPRECDECT
jgi:hypothetical protein